MKSITSDSIWLGNYIFFYQEKVSEFSIPGFFLLSISAKELIDPQSS